MREGRKEGRRVGWPGRSPRPDAGRPGQAAPQNGSRARRRSHPHRPARPISSDSRRRPRLGATGTVTASVAWLPELGLGPGGRVTALSKVAEAPETRDNIKAAARWLPTTAPTSPGRVPVAGRPPRTRQRRRAAQTPELSPLGRGGGPLARPGGVHLGASSRVGTTRRDPGSRRCVCGGGRSWGDVAGRLPRRKRAPHATPRRGQIPQRLRRGPGRPARGAQRVTSKIPGCPDGGREGGREGRRGLANRNQASTQRTTQEFILSRTVEVCRKQTRKAQNLERKGRIHSDPIQVETNNYLCLDGDKVQTQHMGAWVGKMHLGSRENMDFKMD